MNNQFFVSNIGTPILGSDIATKDYITTFVEPVVTQTNNNLKALFWLSGTFSTSADSIAGTDGYGGSSWPYIGQISVVKTVPSFGTNHIYNLTYDSNNTAATKMLLISNAADLQVANGGGYVHSMLGLNEGTGTSYTTFNYNGVTNLKTLKAFSISVLLKSNGTIGAGDNFSLLIGQTTDPGFNCSLTYSAAQYTLQCVNTGSVSAAIPSEYNSITTINKTYLPLCSYSYGNLISTANCASEFNSGTASTSTTATVRLQHTVEMKFFKMNDTGKYLVAAYWDNKFITSRIYEIGGLNFTNIMLGATKATNNYKIGASGLYGIPIIY